MFGIALNLHCFCRKASVRWPINRLTPLRRRSRIWLHAFRRVYFGDNRRNAHYPRNYPKDYPRNYSGSHKGQAQTGGGCTPRRVGDRVTGIPKKVLLYSIFMRSLSGQFRLGRLLSKSRIWRRGKCADWCTFVFGSLSAVTWWDAGRWIMFWMCRVPPRLLCSSGKFGLHIGLHKLRKPTENGLKIRHEKTTYIAVSGWFWEWHRQDSNL